MNFLVSTLSTRLRRGGIDDAGKRGIDDVGTDPQGLVQAFEQSGMGWFWEVDADGRLTYLSVSVAAQLGDSQDDAIGRPLADFVSDCGGADNDGIGSERTLSFYISRQLPFTDLTVRAANQASVLWSLTGRPVTLANGLIGFRGIGKDISDKGRAEAELRKAARYDSLTDLPNRATILKVLEDTLRPNAGRKGALMLVDLDRFKEVNDSLGHLTGDDILRQVARRLQQMVSRHGTVGRLGGDEFEVVIPGDQDRARIEELAEKCISYISLPYKVGERTLSIGASIGIALAGAHGDDAESLFRKADLALYRAKIKRGTARVFEPEMEMAAFNRQALEHDLRTALASGDLTLAFQPIVSGATEVLAGFEALVRWNHPLQGQINPATIIEIAEDSDLIVQLGEWVLRAACLEAAKWPATLFVAVNVSPTQFAEKDFTRVILNALADSQIPAARLELEVTEGVFLADNPNTDKTFESLKRIGVRLALDDFGTGYSSLAYLERAPFDKLKIDRTFVKGASLPHSRNLPILEAIVHLAHRLEMQTTAEGAETHQELDLIRGLECTYVQGFIFGRPMPADEALEFAARSAPLDAEGFAFSRSTRHRLIRTASLHIGGQTLAVRIRNVSAGGALVEANRELTAGTVAKLEISGYNLLEVEIIWARDKRAGVRFVSEFNLRGLLSASGVPPTPLPKQGAGSS